MSGSNRVFNALVLAALVAFPASELLTASQQQQAPGDIRIQVDVVPVDVIVTDSSNRPRFGLRKQDFIVLENSVPQQIAHFSLQTFGRPGSFHPGRMPATSEEVLLNLPTHRTFLLVLGRGRHNRYFNAVDSMIKFVRSGLTPSDRVAVMAYNRATDFTNQHETIAALLERYKENAGWIEITLEHRYRGLAAVYGSETLPGSLQTKIRAIFDSSEIGSRTVAPGDLPDEQAQRQREREGLEIVSRAEMAALDRLSRERAGVGGISVKGAGSFDALGQVELELMTDLPFDQYMNARAQTRQDLINIYEAIEYLRFVGGEKHLLFFTSEGLFLPALEDERSLASMASDARVRIHAFHTSGPNVRLDFDASRRSERPARKRSPSKGSFTREFALSSLRNVSALTGGQAFIGKYIDDALQTTSQTTRVVYLLGYRPQNTDFDGRFRKIEVRVRGEKLKVYSRRGYYARSTPAPYDREGFMTYARTVAAVNYGEPIQDVAFSFEVDKVVQKDDSTVFDVLLTLQPREEMFSFKEGLYSGRLAVTWFVLSKDGTLLSTQSQALNMNLPERAYRTVLKEGFPLSRRFQIHGRAKNGWLKIILYDPANDKLGSRTKRIS